MIVTDAVYDDRMLEVRYGTTYTYLLIDDGREEIGIYLDEENKFNLIKMLTGEINEH